MEELQDILITFKDKELRLEVGTYPVTNQIILQLYDTEDGLPFMTATKEVEHIELEIDEVIIKSVDENEGVLKALKEAGVIENITEKVQVGFYHLHICKLLL